MKIRLKRLTEDKKYATLIVGIYVAKVAGFFNQNIFGTNNNFQLCLKAFQFICVILVVMPLMKRIKHVLFVECFFVCIYVFSAFLGNAAVNTLLNSAMYVLGIYIPMGLSAFYITNKAEILKMLRFVSYPISIVLLITAFKMSSYNDFDYNMDFGYFMLLPCIIFWYFFLTKKNLIDLLFGVEATVSILMFGSRGPLLCLICFFLLFVFASNEFRGNVKKIIVLGIFFLIVILLLFPDVVISQLIQLTELVSIDSRTFRLLQAGQLGIIGSRTKIINRAMYYLNQQPFIGCGVEAMRELIGTYPHNILVEFLVSFGYPAGFSLCILYLLILVKGVKDSDIKHRSINIIFISFCVELFISKSFLSEWCFFVCMGLCLSGTNKRKSLVLQRKFETNGMSS